MVKLGQRMLKKWPNNENRTDSVEGAEEIKALLEQAGLPELRDR